ncbi:putative phage holin [Streptomyces griseofuscus]|uniref:putative phage holin n=1 Tax=Streptomyces griseofuscus TaxID=146922 RepID=UPI0033E2959A
MSDLGVDTWMNATMSALGAIACAVFAITYHLRATWWRSDIGKNQMAFAVVIGLLCLYTVAATIWQGDRCVLVALHIVRTVVLLAIAVLMVQRTRLLLKAQRSFHDRTGV